MNTTAREQSTSDRVVRAVSEATGTSPRALVPPLFEVLDPDALDALYETAPYPTVTFEYADRTVVVRSDGSVAVEGTGRGTNR